MPIIPTADQLKSMSEHIGDSKVTPIIVSSVVCGIVACAAVGLRIWSRRYIRAKLGMDDWLIIFSLAMYIGFVIGFSLSTKWGAGRHIILVTDLKSLSYDNIANESLYCAALTSIKYSILFLYRRIFPQRWFRNVLITLGAVIMAWVLAAFFCGVFNCVPIDSLWDPTLSGFCIDYGKVTLVIGIINIITDFVMLGLPIPLVWNLKISRQRKLLLTVTFTAGGMVCIVSIVRLLYAEVVGSTADPSWDDIEGGILSSVELCAGIIAACIPTYRPLFNRVLHGSKRDFAPIENRRNYSWEGGIRLQRTQSRDQIPPSQKSLAVSWVQGNDKE